MILILLVYIGSVWNNKDYCELRELESSFSDVSFIIFLSGTIHSDTKILERSETGVVYVCTAINSMYLDILSSEVEYLKRICCLVGPQAFPQV